MNLLKFLMQLRTKEEIDAFWSAMSSVDTAVTPPPSSLLPRPIFLTYRNERNKKKKQTDAKNFGLGTKLPPQAQSIDTW